MTDIQRWSITATLGGPTYTSPDPDGYWVMHEDYIHLLDEHGQLKRRVEELRVQGDLNKRSYNGAHAALMEKAAEVERLTQALKFSKSDQAAMEETWRKIQADRDGALKEIAKYQHAERVLAEHGIELWEKPDAPDQFDGLGFSKFKPLVEAQETITLLREELSVAIAALLASGHARCPGPLGWKPPLDHAMGAQIRKTLAVEDERDGYREKIDELRKERAEAEVRCASAECEVIELKRRVREVVEAVAIELPHPICLGATDGGEPAYVQSELLAALNKAGAPYKHYAKPEGKPWEIAQ